MKNRIRKDLKRRQLVQQYEFWRYLPKSHLPKYLPKDTSPVRIRNRCAITGRGRGVYSNFKLNRIQLRNLIERGELAGFKKSSW